MFGEMSDVILCVNWNWNPGGCLGNGGYKALMYVCENVLAGPAYFKILNENYIRNVGNLWFHWGDLQIYFLIHWIRTFLAKSVLRMSPVHSFSLAFRAVLPGISLVNMTFRFDTHVMWLSKRRSWGQICLLCKQRELCKRDLFNSLTMGHHRCLLQYNRSSVLILPCMVPT